MNERQLLEDYTKWLTEVWNSGFNIPLIDTPILTNEDNQPFDDITDAEDLAELYYPDDVIIITKDGPKLYKTKRTNAWQINTEDYSYYFEEIKTEVRSQWNTLNEDDQIWLMMKNGFDVPFTPKRLKTEEIQKIYINEKVTN